MSLKWTSDFKQDTTANIIRNNSGSPVREYVKSITLPSLLISTAYAKILSFFLPSGWAYSMTARVSFSLSWEYLENAFWHQVAKDFFRYSRDIGFWSSSLMAHWNSCVRDDLPSINSAIQEFGLGLSDFLRVSAVTASSKLIGIPAAISVNESVMSVDSSSSKHSEKSSSGSDGILYWRFLLRGRTLF